MKVGVEPKKVVLLHNSLFMRRFNPFAATCGYTRFEQIFPIMRYAGIIHGFKKIFLINQVRQRYLLFIENGTTTRILLSGGCSHHHSSEFVYVWKLDVAAAAFRLPVIFYINDMILLKLRQVLLPYILIMKLSVIS